MTTGGGIYGEGFVDLEPRLSRDFLTKINSQLDKAFSNIKLDVDDRPLRDIQGRLGLIEGSADRAEDQMAQFARKSGDADTNIRTLAGHMGISEDAARRMTDQIILAERKSEALEDSARETAKALGLSEDQAKRFARAMGTAADSQGSIGRINSSLGTLRSNLALAAGSAIAFFGIRGVLGAATAARDSFIKLGESVNAVEVVFGTASKTIFNFSDQVATSAGLARSEFQQMATVLGSALLNAGFTADEAAAKTITLTQRAADMASVFNTEVADALGAIQSALRGETDPIEKFGVSLTAIAVEGEAAALGFKKVGGEFDTTAKATARLSLIMGQTSRVQGDFVNTSDSLANRQRIVAAETENLRAELGEKLLPIFETLVEAGPALLEGLQDLAPSLQAFAEGVADLGKSTPGVLDLVDALGFLTDLPRGFGAVTDAVRFFGEGIATAGGAVSALVRGDLFGAIANVKEGFEGMGDEAQRQLERINTQGLITDLRSGADATTELANRLAEVGKKGKLDRAFIRGLSEIAGTDLRQTSAALKALIDDSARLGLSADEVLALRTEWVLLNEETLISPRRIDDTTAALADLGNTPAVSALDAVRINAEEAGLSMGDLLAGVDPVAAKFLETLDPADELALRLEAVRTGAVTAADAFNTLFRPALIDVASGLVDLNEDGKVSLSEFTRNLEQAAQDFLDFQVNIAAIAQISPELAKALKELPDEVQAAFLAEGFAEADEAAILAAAEGLTGSPEAISAAILKIYLAGLGAVDRSDPAAVQEWLGIISDSVDIPGVTEVLSAAFQPALDASFADLKPPDLTDQVVASIEGWNSAEIASAVEDALFANVVTVDLEAEGREARATYMKGLVTHDALEAARFRNSITTTYNEAVTRRSPPKLFQDFGEEAGETYWSGFAGVPLQFPRNDLAAASLQSTRSSTLGSADTVTAGGVSGPAIGEVNFYDTRERPAEESLQEAGVRVAVMLNLRKHR